MVTNGSSLRRLIFILAFGRISLPWIRPSRKDLLSLSSGQAYVDGFFVMKSPPEQLCGTGLSRPQRCLGVPLPSTLRPLSPFGFMMMAHGSASFSRGAGLSKPWGGLACCDSGHLLSAMTHIYFVNPHPSLLNS